MSDTGVLLDTSFFIRLLDPLDPLHLNAKGYYRYFLENDQVMYLSTIVAGEYCVRGTLDQLPLKQLKVIPYNLDHAQKAGELAHTVFANKGKLDLLSRTIIPNDTKLFAQAEVENSICRYLSSDTESAKIYNLLRAKSELNFDFLDLSIPHHEAFGLLDL